MSFYDNINKIKYADNHSTYDNSQISYGTWRKWGELAPILYPEYQKIEILAPASKSSYKTAVFNGADAVYFGYKEFNARADGDNFESINEIVDFCHLYRVKAYLALNICFKNSELAQVKDIIIEAESANIDAFIIADLAILPIIKKYSKAQVHASTQMGVHNYKGAEYLSNLGFDRVVLSREASLEEIKGIKDKNIPISIEVFCHGALCVAFSGACLLSSMISGNSGNRGKCSQLCRNLYRCELDGKFVNEGYLLSAKDICMANDIKKLYDLEVDSLKIEGRLRRSEYVAGATSIYSKLRTGDPCESDDETCLKKLFNRGDFTKGYINNANDIIYPYIPSHMGLDCGKIIKILSKKLVLAECKFVINKDDGFKIIRNKQEVCGAVATGEVKNGKYVLFVMTETTVDVGDNISITTDTQLNKNLLENTKKLQIEVAINMNENEKISVIAHCQDAYVEFTDEILQLSENLTITKDNISAQFSKTRDTNFDINVVYAHIGKVYMPKSALNELRRKIITEIENKLLSGYIREKSKKYVNPEDITINIDGDFAEINDKTMLASRLKHKVKNIVYAPNVVKLSDCKVFYKIAKNSDNLIYFKPPIFIPNNKIDLINSIVAIFDGVVASNLSVIKIAQDLNKLVVAGYNLNIMNSKNLLIKTTNQYIASVELNKKDLINMKNCLVYTYGYLPLMYLNHCPRKLNGENCSNCGKKLVYKDAKGQYPITTVKIEDYCQHTLKNGILTNLGNTLEHVNLYFDFTDSTSEEIGNMLYNYYSSGIFDTVNCNKLHLNRGVK